MNTHMHQLLTNTLQMTRIVFIGVAVIVVTLFVLLYSAPYLPAVETLPVHPLLNGTLATSNDTRVTIYPEAQSLCLPNGTDFACYTLVALQDKLGLQHLPSVDFEKLTGETR